MNVAEKRDYIVSRLYQDENIIDQFYETLRKSDVLKEKLESRAKKSESDIKAGRVFSRTEIEQKTSHFGRK